MKALRLIWLVCLCFAVGPAWSQSISVYNPQALYDAPGGLYDPSILREMHVTFQDDNYHDVLVDAFFNNPSLRIPATVEMDGEVLGTVGTRYKGNSTFCLPLEIGSVKLPYNLDFNHWVSGQQLMGYNKVKLANSWMDPTYCKEYLASRIYRKYLPTPQINLVKLYTQDNYTGLYVNTESINKQFLEKHFGEDDGVLFKCDGAAVFCSESGPGTPGGEPNLDYLGPNVESYYDSYTMKSEEGWYDLLNLITTLHFNPENLGDVLNIDRVLWALAVNAVVSNLDTYNGYYVHNYYLYEDEQNRFQMIPWDLDNSFVGAILGYSFWSPNDVYHFDPFFSGGWQWSPRPLTDYLFSQPEYRRLYLAHIRTILNESMDVASLNQEVDAMQALVADAALSDGNSLFGPWQFYENVDQAFWADWGFAGIISTIEPRVAFLSAHPEINVLTPTIGEVEAVGGVIQASALNAESVELMWTNPPYAGDFQSIAMSDNGTMGDVEAGDGVYSVAIPDGAEEPFLFYVRASNDEAVKLMPERAEYEYFVYGDLLGTDEPFTFHNAQKEGWTLAPNPARGSFRVLNCAERTRLQVRDAQGRFVREVWWTGQPIDVSDWQRGMFLISADNGRAMKLLVH